MFKNAKSAKILFSLVVSASLFTGCASLDAPIYDYQASANCNLNNVAAIEPYHMRFEIVEEDKSNMPGYVHMENTRLLESGSESLVFTGNKAAIQHGFSESSQVWVLASMGVNKAGGLCLKTRTATRPAGLSGDEARTETILTEQVYNIEMGGLCGEAILEEKLNSLGNAKLRISSAPKSTAEYLNNPEAAMDSSCAQLVDSMSPEQGNQFKSELKSVLGV